MQKKNKTFKFRSLNISQVILLELGEYYITNPGNPGTIIREINQHLPATVASPFFPWTDMCSWENGFPFFGDEMIYQNWFR